MIIIPMAGLSQRFLNAGFKIPKYMLDLHGKTLFYRTVSSFKKYFDSEEFLFISRDEPESINFIRKEVKKLGLRSFDIQIVTSSTRGQADTVRIGIESSGIDLKQSITIFNIDTIRPNFSYPDKSWLTECDGYLEVMNSLDPGYSYALPDPVKADRVIKTAEKKVISNLASTGIYYFNRAETFMSSFKLEMLSPSASELYVAPLYNHIIEHNGQVYYDVVLPSDVIFCGVPDQYYILQKNPELFFG